MPTSWGPYESVTPASNQQIIPALQPVRTTPASQASRSISSSFDAPPPSPTMCRSAIGAESRPVRTGAAPRCAKVFSRLGCSFSLGEPISEDRRRPVVSSQPEPTAVNTVLICEDDPNLRTLVRLALGDRYRFFEAPDGPSVLALLIAAAFGVLIYAVTTLDNATKRERHAKTVTAQTLQLEKLVLDLDTGLRGFVLTGKKDLLAPWTSARAALPARLHTFRRLASTTSEERRRAETLVTSINQYLNDYAEPVITIAQTFPAASQQRVVSEEGARELGAVRSR